MYFDNLTLVSLLVFAGALGAFIYACLYRGCISGNNGQDGKHDDS